MQVLVKSGEAIVKLQKRERDLLANAAELLRAISKHTEGELAESAGTSSSSITGVVLRDC